jgi:hypothetical protein
MWEGASMKNTYRSKVSSRGASKRKRKDEKPSVASIARRYLELQQLRMRLTIAQAGRSSV